MKSDAKTDGNIGSTSLTITAEILQIIAEIDEFKGAWMAIGRIAPERLSSLRHVATIESIGSSTRIEGSKLTDQEVERLLSTLEITEFTSRDEQEIAGYARVMETIFAHADDIPLTENHIFQLHRDLLQFAHKDERHRGAYKTISNSVEAFGPDGKSLGVVFETASPFNTPRLIAELIEWTNASLAEQRHHPLLTIAIFVVTFLEIHPFQDGNGRLSRVLTTLLLLRTGYAYVPYSSLESIVEQSKEAYYLALRRTQGTIRTKNPDWQPWVSYFLNALQTQKQRLESKIEREHRLLGNLPKLSIMILEQAKEHGRVTVADVARQTGRSRNTIKGHFQALTKAGHLQRRGAGRGTWYALN